jgi:hypothetical protein
MLHVRSADASRARAAGVAFGWVALFAAWHVYWYLGGSFADPGTLPGWPHSPAGYAFEVFVVGSFVLGLLVPWTLARGRAGARTAGPIALVLWTGAVLLDLRGGSGLVDDALRAAGSRTGITGLTTEQATGLDHLTWAGWAIDGYFMLGGVIFTWLAVLHRRRRVPSPAPLDLQ